MTQPIRPTQTRRRSAHTKLFGTGDLQPTTRCSIIVAHPADEVVGAGCLISKLVDVTVLHVTDGAPVDTPDAQAAGFSEVCEYAEARKKECLEALGIAKVPHDRVVELEVNDHHAIHCLADLTKRITTFLQKSAPDIIITHPYEGGHPEHDATAFATHNALRLLKKNGLNPPVLFEMALHPGDDDLAKVPEFLLDPGRETTTLLLDERAQELKRRMFDCFDTQRESMRASALGPEKFRQPAYYDFSAPPRTGKLHYEKFDWAPSKEAWQTLAAEALSALFPESRPQLSRSEAARH